MEKKFKNYTDYKNIFPSSYTPKLWNKLFFKVVLNSLNQVCENIHLPIFHE